MNGYNLTPGRFYTKFEDETLDKALQNHSVGYTSLESAIDDANFSELKPIKFVVYDSDLKIVHEGVTRGNNV